MRSLQRRHWILLVAALALFLRTIVAVVYPAVPTADAADYHRLAQSLLAGQGYLDEHGRPFGFQPPGYPAFVALLYWFGGVSPQFAYLGQAMLGALAALLVSWLSLLVFGKDEDAFWAGLVAATYPTLIFLCRSLISENLYVAYVLATLCVAVLFARKPTVGAALGLGALLGTGALVRSANIFLVGTLLGGFAFVFFRRHNLRALGLVTVAGLIAMACIAPWTYRNYQVFGHFVPVVTSDGLTLYGSYFPPTRDGKRLWGKVENPGDPVYDEAIKIENAAERSQFFKHATFQGLAAHPARFFTLLPEKLVFLALPVDYEILPQREDGGKRFNWGYLIVALPMLLGLVGLVRRSRAKKAGSEEWILLAMPLAAVLQAALFYGSPRFRAPAEAVLLVLVPLGARELVGWVRRPLNQS